MTVLKLMLMGILIVSASLALTACEQESALGEAIEDVADELDDAT